MLIKQNQLLGEATSFLDSLEQLTLDEASFTPYQVNVRHNQRLGQDLVQLESFLGYAQSNGIDDAGYALHRVCEANEVPRDSLAFLANEENLLEDDELLDTFVQLYEAGFPVHVAPISDGSPYYLALLEALNLDQAYDSYEESPNLIMYVNESIIDDAKDKISGFASSVKSGVSNAASTVKNKVTGAAGAVKDKVSGGAKAVASKLASVRKEIAKKSAEILKATGPAKVFIKRQINKLKDAAKELKAKLVRAKDAVGEKLSSAGKSIKDAASSIGDKFSGATDSVKSGVKGIGSKISGAASTAGSKISGAASSVSSGVKSGLSTAGSKISGAAGSVKSGLGSVGSKISDAASSAKNKASQGIDSIKAKFA